MANTTRTEETNSQTVSTESEAIEHSVHVGQVYADLDRRSQGRRKVEVMSIDEATGKASVKVVGGERTSVIRLDRFATKNYQLVSDDAGTEQTH